MRTILAIAVLFLLSGCIGNPPRQTEIARHDLGDLPGAWNAAGGIPIAGVGVRAASWLDTPEQAYRLAYADTLRRRAYTESRWIAPPAELFERFLTRRIVFGQTEFKGPGCRLGFMLDELEQRFDSPQTSEVVLEVQVSLLPPRGKGPVAKRSFVIRQPAPTPDAQGGVRATRAAAQALVDALARWLDAVAREQPQVISACKEAS